MNESWTDIQIIQAIQSGDPDGIKSLYHLYYKMVADFIKNNSGSQEDAEDIFQETLIALISKVRSEHFQLSSKLSSYLYSISRNIWLYRLRKAKNKSFSFIEGHEDIIDQSQLPEIEEFEEKHVFIARVFEKINADCQKILTEFYFEEKALKDIGAQMNYTEGSIRVKKSRCMDTLKKLIEDHPDYKQIFEK